MLKKEGCTNQFPDVPVCQPLFCNTYECPCGNVWEDKWSATCDDECSECGREISPSQSTIVNRCACRML